MFLYYGSETILTVHKKAKAVKNKPTTITFPSVTCEKEPAKRDQYSIRLVFL